MGLSNLWFYMPAAVGMVLLFLVMLRRAVVALLGKPHDYDRRGERDMMSLSLVVLFLLFVVMGLPIAMAMGLAAGAVVWWFDMPLAVLAQRTVNSLDSTPLLAVPMFIFAAAIFNNTGITTQLFDFVRMVIGRIRGGLGHVTVRDAPGVLGRLGRGARRHRRARQHPDQA